MELIEPCPFCNSSSAVVYHWWGFDFVKCEDDGCGAIGPKVEDDPAEAIRRWNRRASDER